MSTNTSDIMTPKEVSDMTGLSLKTLAHHRSKKIGFPFYKFNRKVFYKESEVLATITETRVETTEQVNHNAS